MRIKQQSCHSPFGNKTALLITLDAFFAVVVVTLVLTASVYYATRPADQDVTRLQMTRAGGDIVAMLDYQDYFDTLDETAIQNRMDSILPINYDMRINITTNNSIMLAIGNEVPDDRSLGTGKRVFVVSAGGEITDFGIAQFWIWLK